MKTRAWISLSVAGGFATLGVTGVLLYILPHSNLTAAIHTTFGAAFLLVVAFHIRNNFRALRGYVAPRARPRRWLLSRELALAAVPIGLLLAGVFLGIPGFRELYDLGNQWRSQQDSRREDQQTYQYLETNAAAGGLRFELDVKKGPAFGYPVFAVWIEDPESHFVQTLYLSQGIARSRLLKEVNGQWIPGEVRRPEALPYWGHRRGIQAPDGYYLPDADHPIPDAVTSATPTENWLLRTRTDRPLTRFTIYVEVNRSFDWNDYYAKDRFPGDPIYSGSGKNGQPSVIYAATIDLSQHLRYYALNPVGHGHHSGADGQLYPDLSQLTTALDIVDSITLRLPR